MWAWNEGLKWGPEMRFQNLNSGQRMKNGTFRALFGGFSSLFLSIFRVSVIYIYIGSQFWKKIGLSLLLADARAPERKFPMPTGLPTTNSTNKYPNVKQLSWAINYCAWHILAHVHGRSRRTRAWQGHARARGHTTRMRVATNRAGILLAIMRPGQLNRWHLHSVSHHLISASSEQCRAVIDTWDLSDNWSEGWDETWHDKQKDEDKDKDIGSNSVIYWLSGTVDFSWQIEKLTLRVSDWRSEIDLDSIRNSCDVLF